MSGELFVGTSDGVFKVRTVKRVPRKDRFDINLLNCIRGTPWDLKGTQVPELPVDQQLQPIPVHTQRLAMPATVAVAGEESEVRDFKIFKKDLEKHGYTINCQGCDAARNNAAQRPHNTECRERENERTSYER